MDVLACIKRVPDTGATIVLTDDGEDIDTSNLGFTMSPHEECAIEEAIRLTEDNGGSSRVLTLGPDEATEQLRTGLAMGADDATLLETDGEEWPPRATAAAIADAVRDGDSVAHDLLLFGNESADMANHQVGVRVARRLDLPVVTGIKDLAVADGTVTAKREVAGGREVYEVELPAVVTVKEGINAPRYASMRSKMQARKQSVDHVMPEHESGAGTLEKIELIAPEADEGEAEILGEGPDAVPRILEVLRDEVEVV